MAKSKAKHMKSHEAVTTVESEVHDTHSLNTQDEGLNDQQAETADHQMDHQTPHQDEQQTVNDSSGENNDRKNHDKVKIEFPYSDLIRAKAPKAFDVAEKVATQWKNDEKFEDLGLPHPLAEVAAVKALEKAKEVEKKLEEKGVITAAKMGVEIAKIQAQQFLNKLKK